MPLAQVRTWMRALLAGPSPRPPSAGSSSGPTSGPVAGPVAGLMAALIAAACLSLPSAGWAQASADPLSDAPEGRTTSAAPVFIDAPTYAEALARWRSAADVNAWIAARFDYDRARAIELSETQRQRNGRMPIIAPTEFFARPRGVCVDLARFGVETLRHIDPAAKATYLMIEFDPLTIAGQTLRRHWLVVFESGGQRYFFADSKRPGLIAGPYASTRAFIDEYQRYRGRRIVAFQERESFERQLRQAAGRQQQEPPGAAERPLTPRGTQGAR